MRRGVALLVVLDGVLAPGFARACGAAYPGGPVMCSLERDGPSRKGDAPAPPPRAHVFASYALASTTLSFGGDRASLLRHALFAGSELPLGANVSIRLGAGGVVGGELSRRGRVYALGPGAAAFAGVGARILPERGIAPFVQVTGTFSATRAATRSEIDAPTFTAFDLRAAVIAGKTLGHVLTPYAAARVFGGPIAWRAFGDDRTGTDLYKYQIGAGASVTLGRGALDLFVEGIALGERGVATGVGTTFF